MKIQVRDYKGESIYCSTTPPTIETIDRKPIAVQIGNFNPIFARYKGKEYQVHSDTGDLSDPFRRTKEDTRTAFIDISKAAKV